MDAEKIWRQLSSRGFKMTQTRQKILQILMLTSGWLTANSLYEELLAQKVRIDLSTVCRNLDMLYNIGLLCRVDRERNGIFAYHLRDMEEHHHHLICLSCGKTLPLEYCPLNGLSTSQTEGFTDLECHFEVYGYCRDCQCAD